MSNNIKVYYQKLKNALNKSIYCFMQSVPNTNDVVSSNSAHDEGQSIQHCVIKFVSNLR